jgi:2-polyprenyl-3-methyl-5-hydroxy-6-metoxy-1,4-benzoquinol methylase
MNLNKRNKKWQTFFQNNFGNKFPHQSLIIFFNRNFYKLKKKINILDLGSGTGSTLKLIDKKNFFIDFVDISKIALKQILKKNLKQNIEVYNQNFNDYLKVSKKKYDLIIDSTSLQHQTEKEIKVSFGLIKKNLKQNGFFFSINLNSYKGLHNENFYVTKFSKKKILNLFKLCKLKSIDYNQYHYTENNSKYFIKYNVITGKNI